jgi:hypothetical protein
MRQKKISLQSLGLLFKNKSCAHEVLIGEFWLPRSLTASLVGA